MSDEQDDDLSQSTITGIISSLSSPSRAAIEVMAVMTVIKVMGDDAPVRLGPSSLSSLHHCYHFITGDAGDSSDDLSGFVSDFNPVTPVLPVEIFFLHRVISDDAPVRFRPSSPSSLHHCHHLTCSSSPHLFGFSPRRALLIASSMSRTSWRSKISRVFISTLRCQFGCSRYVPGTLVGEVMPIRSSI